MTKIEELLKVFDLSEDEQKSWLVNHGHIDLKYVKIPWSIVLADLAFRLRRGAISENSDNWATACWYVQQWISFHKIRIWNIPSFDGLNNAEHEILTKEAIVWIVTALIAKAEKP